MDDGSTNGWMNRASKHATQRTHRQEQCGHCLQQTQTQGVAPCPGSRAALCAGRTHEVTSPVSLLLPLHSPSVSTVTSQSTGLWGEGRGGHGTRVSSGQRERVLMSSGELTPPLSPKIQLEGCAQSRFPNGVTQQACQKLSGFYLHYDKMTLT